MYDKAIRVLLVEDDEDDYVFTRDLLEEIGPGKFELTWAATYPEALELIGRSGLHPENGVICEESHHAL